MYDLKEKQTLADEVEKSLDATKRKQQLKAYDNKIEELAQTIEDNIQRHGQDYFMVDILTMFLDVSIKMKDVMEMMSSMNMVMELFGDAVAFIDESMELQSNIMQDTGKVKYNLWTRITGYFQTRRIIRNNINRVTSMSQNILIKYRMANDMVTALQGVSVKLKTMTNKIGKKSSKLSAKKNGGAGSAQYSDAEKYLNARRSAKGEKPLATSSAPSSDSTSGGLDLSGI